jgi:uncharacterized protein YhaN
MLTLFILISLRKKAIRKSLLAQYDAPPEDWIPMAEAYAEESPAVRMEALQQQIEALCEDESIESLSSQCRQILSLHDAYAAAQLHYQRCADYAATVTAMATTVDHPPEEDTLTYTEEETGVLLTQASQMLHQIRLRTGQLQGQMTALGEEQILRSQLESVQMRLSKLADTHAAICIALEALQEAKADLQRRFAPKLVKRTQEIFAALTGNRYTRLSLDPDLHLQASAEGENILRSTLWRSDGTVDQLYLALRIAVAGELCPDAPLILDDALVRFDDDRLAAALSVLREEAKQTQVILFTCQGRESRLLPTI